MLSPVTLPKADVQIAFVPSLQHIALYIWNITVVLFPLALRQRTRTRFSFQGATGTFFVAQTKAEIQGLKPETPNHCR
jgi:hypothetical protein